MFSEDVEVDDNFGIFLHPHIAVLRLFKLNYVQISQQQCICVAFCHFKQLHYHSRNVEKLKNLLLSCLKQQCLHTPNQRLDFLAVHPLRLSLPLLQQNVISGVKAAEAVKKLDDYV